MEPCGWTAHSGEAGVCVCVCACAYAHMCVCTYVHTCALVIIGMKILTTGVYQYILNSAYFFLKILGMVKGSS